MSPEEYIAERLEDQINWYDTNSRNAQFKFKALRITEVICAAVIPLLAGFNPFESTSLAVGILGIVIGICAAMIGLGNYQENWIEYRTTSESLRHEKFLFLTSATPYDQPDPFNLFVQRTEGLISRENSTWSQAIRAQKSLVNTDRQQQKTEREG